MPNIAAVKMMGSRKKTGIIGCGNMGSALSLAIKESGFCPARSIYVSDVSGDRTDKLKSLGMKVSDNRELTAASDIIIMAVKPDVFPKVAAEIKDILVPQKVFVSVAAGIATRQIEKYLDEAPIPVIRVMPNVNIKVKAGIIAYCMGRHAAGLEKLAEDLFSPLGAVLELPESRFDAVTAISGSGPGFLFYIAEQMKRICKEKKFTEKQAALITAQLFCGSGKMLSETGLSPALLKDMVASRGGTTEAGLEVFQKRDFPALLKQVIEKAEKRSSKIT